MSRFSTELRGDVEGSFNLKLLISWSSSSEASWSTVLK